jgi:hypothetical protein
MGKCSRMSLEGAACPSHLRDGPVHSQRTAITSVRVPQPPARRAYDSQYAYAPCEFEFEDEPMRRLPRIGVPHCDGDLDRCRGPCLE